MIYQVRGTIDCADGTSFPAGFTRPTGLEAAEAMAEYILTSPNYTGMTIQETYEDTNTFHELVRYHRLTSGWCVEIRWDGPNAKGKVWHHSTPDDTTAFTADISRVVIFHPIGVTPHHVVADVQHWVNVTYAV